MSRGNGTPNSEVLKTALVTVQSVVRTLLSFGKAGLDQSQRRTNIPAVRPQIEDRLIGDIEVGAYPVVGFANNASVVSTVTARF